MCTTRRTNTCRGDGLDFSAIVRFVLGPTTKICKEGHCLARDGRLGTMSLKSATLGESHVDARHVTRPSYCS